MRYMLDFRLFASVTIEAESEQKAIEIITAQLDCAEVNLGAWPDGSPIIAEASIEGAPDVLDILED